MMATKAFSSNRDALIAGVRLITDLIPIRAGRRGGDDAAALATRLTQWHGRREDWRKRMVAGAGENTWMPLLSLTERFSLNDDELNVLLVVLASEVDPEFLDQVRGAQDPLFQTVDVELVLGLLFHSVETRFEGRRLLSHDAPLIRHGLILLRPLGSDVGPSQIEVRPTGSLANFVLERPLLTGGLAQFCELVAPEHTWDRVILPIEQKSLVWDIVAGEPVIRQKLDEWGYGPVMRRGRGVVLLFAGPPGTGKTAFAHAIAERMGRSILVVRSSRLLAGTEPLQPLLTDVFRIASLANAVVLMDDCEELFTDRDARFLALLEALNDNAGVLILTSNLAPRIDFAMARRILYRLDFEPPSALLREQIWEVHLPPEAPLGSDIDVATLASTYEFTGAVIRNTILIALSRLAAHGVDTLTMQRISDAAETQLGARFDEFAVRANTDIGLDRLILPDKQREQLGELLDACRHHADVLNRWGFGKRLSTGRGICALFDGPPGTGKTFTAEILATELKLPLYRVHIPNVVSKWIGETERNIAEIFVRARASRAMLLFDEADSLFGRRSSTVSSATDRYANMEVNLLLQEIERYDGITMLTTNLFGNLDEALQRRIQFRISFPFPEAEERARIWQILVPAEAPLGEDVSFPQLGKQFELSGGHIKNALLRAAYRARSAGDIILRQYLLDAALHECEAQGKLVRKALSKKPDAKV